ncbi:MAG: UDP-N-acetylmuramoyl-L-alanine--D-glutamate ligase [Sedimentisphaerales bacterium]|nr:UDP-N-acetylmuramoyl-L-alanine--D-glutamate ligase [Sedimentisphaerales bacterium]
MKHFPPSSADYWQARRVLVMGLGSFGGGIGVTRFLAGRGAQVTVTDQRSRQELAESLDRLGDCPVAYHLGGHDSQDFTRARTDVVVVNPAVKRDNPYLCQARGEGLVLTSEMNLFFELCPATIVGVTGSNGKSTTAAMTAAVLAAGSGEGADIRAGDGTGVPAAGRREDRNVGGYRRVWLGGNIGGENLLCRLDGIAADDVVVLELSSFQLEDLGRIERSPQVAVVTNIAPNHLDWHGDMDAYVRAKQNILRFQASQDYAVLNRQDPMLTGWSEITRAKVHGYPQEDLVDFSLQVPGRHNQLNAAAAWTVGGLFGVADQTARRALADYRALPHRLERVGRRDGVTYYNDSIATTPESVMAALDSFAEPKVLILGGYDKKISFRELAERIVACRSVAYVLLLGQVRDILAAELDRARQAAGSSQPQYEKVDDLARAVEMARRRASVGSVVLLSPACASYDMFRNFQQRGDLFRRLVQAFAESNDTCDTSLGDRRPVG